LRIFNPVIRATIFKQFCGGISLENSAETIDHLKERNTYTVLDYGAEAKSSEKDFDLTLQENLRAIQFASTHKAISVISSKVTALASFDLLEKFQAKQPLSVEEQNAFERIAQRMDRLCQAASENGGSYLF
jgi:proline dehydrogenase